MYKLFEKSNTCQTTTTHTHTHKLLPIHINEDCLLFCRIIISKLRSWEIEKYIRTNIPSKYGRKPKSTNDRFPVWPVPEKFASIEAGAYSLLTFEVNVSKCMMTNISPETKVLVDWL
jgi:hypothetical protein